MYIKDYPYARIVEKNRVLECFANDFNPIGRGKRLVNKFVGTYCAMTEKGPSHKFHLNLKEELIVILLLLFINSCVLTRINLLFFPIILFISRHTLTFQWL